jgi:Domain of unknown function (DUF3362)
MPHDIATALYYTGIDPFTKQQDYVAKGLRDRKMQRALMQVFKPENWFTVREARIQAGRRDLIGSGCDCLIPAQPPGAVGKGRHDPWLPSCRDRRRLPRPLTNSAGWASLATGWE